MGQYSWGKKLLPYKLHLMREIHLSICNYVDENFDNFKVQTNRPVFRRGGSNPVILPKLQVAGYT